MYDINLIVPTIFTTWALRHSFEFCATNQHNLGYKYNALLFNNTSYNLTEIITTPENDGTVMFDNSFDTYDGDAKSIIIQVGLYQSDIEATIYTIKCQYHTLE